MATTITNPEVTTKATPITLTANAIAKVKEIMAQQNPVPAGLRVGVVGGGCSGFSYSMSFENAAGMMDKTFYMDGLKVYVDATYDYVRKGQPLREVAGLLCRGRCRWHRRSSRR